MAMNMAEYLSKDMIMTGLAPVDKKAVCEAMVDHIVAMGQIDADRRDPLVEKLMEREGLSSTGIGGGVAIPHASGEAIDSMLVAVAQIPDGVEFDALDSNPVKLVFMIIGSERSPRTHLQLLAMIVRICKNKEVVESLINAASQHAVYEQVVSASA